MWGGVGNGPYCPLWRSLWVTRTRWSHGLGGHMDSHGPGVPFIDVEELTDRVGRWG